MKNIAQADAITAFKVFDPKWTCNPNGARFHYEVGKTYEHKGRVSICNSGFHACLQVADCFNYYGFDSDNKVAEVRIWGQVDEKDGDSKICAQFIEIVREITWQEVLVLANTGKNNTGLRNSGYRNSGSRNSGDSNSGYRNSGDSNSGYRNSGDSNSGYRNSGSWNSGSRNSGDSNSGYRNSGAFCTNENPEIELFDKPSDMTVKQWEEHPAMQILARSLETHFWIGSSEMTAKEKKEHPDHETTGGYLKALTLHEAWKNMWPNLDEKSQQIFLDLPNFDAAKFEEITGIKIKKGKK